MKALQAGDTAGAEMHMGLAGQALSEGEAKMHLDEAMKALQAGYHQYKKRKVKTNS
jgi:hypothetical protein